MVNKKSWTCSALIHQTRHPVCALAHLQDEKGWLSKQGVGSSPKHPRRDSVALHNAVAARSAGKRFWIILGGWSKDFKVD